MFKYGCPIRFAAIRQCLKSCPSEIVDELSMHFGQAFFCFPIQKRAFLPGYPSCKAQFWAAKPQAEFAFVAVLGSILARLGRLVQVSLQRCCNGRSLPEFSSLRSVYPCCIITCGIVFPPRIPAINGLSNWPRIINAGSSRKGRSAISASKGKRRILPRKKMAITRMSLLNWGALIRYNREVSHPCNCFRHILGGTFK